MFGRNILPTPSKVGNTKFAREHIYSISYIVCQLFDSLLILRPWWTSSFSIVFFLFVKSDYGVWSQEFCIILSFMLVRQARVCPWFILFQIYIGHKYLQFLSWKELKLNSSYMKKCAVSHVFWLILSNL
jgi:hypothetical protein